MIQHGLQELAAVLFKVGAVKFGAFRLKLHETHPDAPLSPIFFNLRTADNPKPGPLRASDLAMIAEGFEQMIARDKICYDGVCAIPNAGTPFATTLQERSNGQLQIVELAKQDNGTKRRIDGVLAKGGLHRGARVLLIDDVVTGADTKIEAIKVLRDAGFVVSDLLIIVDRQQDKGRETVEAQNVRIHSLFTMRDLIAFYFLRQWIGQDKHREVLAYLGLD